MRDEITAQTQASGTLSDAFVGAVELAKRRGIERISQVSLSAQEVETYGGERHVVSWDVEVRGRTA